jgi:threonine/homoserine/homoserine lactone efflux protein
MTNPFDFPTLLAYSAASALLVAAPGPGQALIIARTLSGGTRAGVLTALGLQLGTLVHTAAAALGLSAILATSATAFSVVKYVGAAYLIVLGILMLRASRKPHSAVAKAAPVAADNRRLVMHAAITGVLNPKVALFFLAFLPQFVHPERGLVLMQFFTLGLILAVISIIGDSAVAYAAGHARDRLLTNSRFMAWRERATGLVLIALGLRLAFVARR